LAYKLAMKGDFGGQAHGGGRATEVLVPLVSKAFLNSTSFF
jgi:hypothetical protein